VKELTNLKNRPMTQKRNTLTDGAFHKAIDQPSQKEIVTTENHFKSFSKLQTWMDWSVSIFKNATAFSAINKLKSEANELQWAIKAMDKSRIKDEYADCLLCLFNSASNSGFTAQELIQAAEEKAEINYNRTWKIDGSGNTYSHVK
jgi:phosphoribosyl-ATP pyrophosphohydrolase